MMIASVRRPVAALVTVLLAACSNGSSTPTIPMQNALAGHRAALNVPPKDSLYVSDTNGDVVKIYAPGSKDPTDTITDTHSPGWLTFSSTGTLAISSDGAARRNGTINIYKPQALKSDYVISFRRDAAFSSLATNRKGLVYESGGAQVVSFKTDSQTPVAIYNLPFGPVRGMTFNSKDDLAVAAKGAVFLYKSGSTTLDGQIKKIDATAALYDTNGFLAVADFDTNSVNIYAPGSTTDSYSITEGINGPLALALDASNNLYVANQTSSTVTVYDEKGKLTRTISEGMNKPSHLAIDSKGMLFVCNTNDVTGYASGSDKLSVTLKTPCNDIAASP
jgi:sugar lactone lactonase YvrE